MFRGPLAKAVASNMAGRCFGSAAATQIPRTASARWASRGIFSFAACAGATCLVLGTTTVFCSSHASGASAVPPFDYEQVRKDLDDLISSDYGKSGPLLVRLAWHEAASWSSIEKNGAPNTASMRFKPESEYGGNKGLDKARALLEPIKAKHPNISYADLWVLAAVVAIDVMNGPEVPFRWGRKDAKDGSVCAEARLPDASQTQDHVRCVFGKRFALSARETVALIGAHTVGGCYAENSGFVGPWTHDRYGFDNSFFTELLENDWILDQRYPQLQFTDSRTRKLMMLPADVALLLDPEYKKYVLMYAKDQDLFYKDFAESYQKLLEFGTKDLKYVAKKH